MFVEDPGMLFILLAVFIFSEIECMFIDDFLLVCSRSWSEAG